MRSRSAAVVVVKLYGVRAHNGNSDSDDLWIRWTAGAVGVWLLALGARLVRRKAGERMSRPPSGGAATPPAPTRGARLDLVAALASAAGFAGYLTLLGGLLLTLRFWHAGLPVTQAVAAVPPTTMITTAFLELTLGGALIIGVFLFYVAPVVLSRRPPHVASTPSRESRGFTAVRVGALLLVGSIVPLDLYGVIFASTMGLLAFPSVWLRFISPVDTTPHRGLPLMLLILAALPAIPVLARQLVDPVNMERVEIRRAGKPVLDADLVAVRDGSVVIGRCGRLLILPLPEEASVRGLPGSFSGGRSILDRLGIRDDPPARATLRCR